MYKINNFAGAGSNHGQPPAPKTRDHGYFGYHSYIEKTTGLDEVTFKTPPPETR